MEININTTQTQSLSSSQADAFVKAHLGLRTTVSEPASVNTNPPFPLEGTDNHLPTAIQMTDGIYTDTRSKLLSAGVTTIQGTEYQRILDEEVLKVLKANMSSDSFDGDNLIASKFKALTSIGTWFKDSANVDYFAEINQTSIETLETGSLNTINRTCNDEGVIFLKKAKRIDTGAILPTVAAFLPCINGMSTTGWGYSYAGKGCNVVDFGKKQNNPLTTGNIAQGSVSKYYIIRTTTVFNPCNRGGINDGGSALWFFDKKAIEDFKASSSWSYVLSRMYEIGGTKWAEIFGSTDEYADIDKYVTDPSEREEIKQAYRNA